MASFVSCDLTISLDGFVTGPNQTLERPFGDGEGEQLHRWQFEDRENNETEVAAIVAHKAFIMGRNMFSPGGGEWTPIGEAGGAKIRHTTRPSSCSRTIRVHPWRWTVGRRTRS